MLNMQTFADRERIDLLRGGSVVSSFAGAFGSALRETRLTAMLGYVIALEPERFCEIFAFHGRPRSVSLETRHASDRSDILIETTAGRGVIEAKVTEADPFRQSLKYTAKWRVLLTEHMASGKQKRRRGVKYLRWRDLAKPLMQLAESRDNRARFVSRDLLSYLEEHAMIKPNKSVEIYAREINSEETLAMFLQAQMYGCHYQKSRRMAEANYFAPDFGQRIARRHPGVQVGISYIARIERVEVGETWKELLQLVQEVKDKHWLNSHMNLLQPLHRDWVWPRKRSFLFLSKPRLVFNPPILKENLHLGAGFLGKLFFSFDELFEAWGR
ncbi:MAG: hypothetical protein WBP79_04980 [Candidatus Acidiferrales bacterium]